MVLLQTKYEYPPFNASNQNINLLLVHYFFFNNLLIKELLFKYFRNKQKLLDYDDQNTNHLLPPRLFLVVIFNGPKRCPIQILSKPSHQLMLILALLLQGESSILDCIRQNLKPSG